MRLSTCSNRYPPSKVCLSCTIAAISIKVKGTVRGVKPRHCSCIFISWYNNTWSMDGVCGGELHWLYHDMNVHKRAVAGLYTTHGVFDISL